MKTGGALFILTAMMLLVLIPASGSAAESIIQKFEGLRLKAYPDAGSYSIGYGSQWDYDHGRPVVSTDIISAQTALKWLKLRNDENRDLLNKLVKVPLNTSQKDSLLSFIYNIGVGAFSHSTLLKKLNSGRPKKEVGEEFDRWVYSKGKINQDLVNRRKEEKKLFLA